MEEIKTKKRAVELGYKEYEKWISSWQAPKISEKPIVVKNTEYFHETQCEKILSVTEGKRKKLKLKENVEPVAYKSASFGKRVEFPVYRLSDFEESNIKSIPPKKINILEAIFIVNRTAKRYRDASQNHYENYRHSLAKANKERKIDLYKLKDAGIQYAFLNDLIEFHGFHSGFAVYKGDGYYFHSYIYPKQKQPSKHQLQKIEDETLSVNSKKKESGEARLKDAVFTLEDLDFDGKKFSRLKQKVFVPKFYYYDEEDDELDDEYNDDY